MFSSLHTHTHTHTTTHRLVACRHCSFPFFFFLFCFSIFNAAVKYKYNIRTHNWSYRFLWSQSGFCENRSTFACLLPLSTLLLPSLSSLSRTNEHNKQFTLSLHYTLCNGSMLPHHLRVFASSHLYVLLMAGWFTSVHVPIACLLLSSGIIIIIKYYGVAAPIFLIVSYLCSCLLCRCCSCCCCCWKFSTFIYVCWTLLAVSWNFSDVCWKTLTWNLLSNRSMGWRETTFPLFACDIHTRVCLWIEFLFHSRNDSAWVRTSNSVMR